MFRKHLWSGKQFLGNVPAWKKENIPMATKVNPWGGKGLGRESVFKQFETSLTNMKVDKGVDSKSLPLSDWLAHQMEMKSISF